MEDAGREESYVCVGLGGIWETSSSQFCYTTIIDLKDNKVELERWLRC